MKYVIKPLTILRIKRFGVETVFVVQNFFLESLNKLDINLKNNLIV